MNRDIKGRFIKGYSGFNGINTKETKMKMRESALLQIKKGIRKGLFEQGHIHSEETCKNISNGLKGRKLSKEHIRKCLKRNPKSTLEIKFENIIDENNLPYKFVGDGKFFIERKCPDFINTNGKKIAIEVYANYYKKIHGNVENWKIERKQLFREYGWELLFFNEMEVNEKNIMERLV